MKPQLMDKETTSIGSSDLPQADHQALKLWAENPRLVFERLRSLVCEAVQICSSLYDEALSATPGVTLASLAPDVLDLLHRAIVEALEIWDDTPISRYLDRPEGPVRLSRSGHGIVTGSCYHDLGLTVALRAWQGAQGSEGARDFVRSLSYHTAAGDNVAMYLASLIPQVRCECQKGLSRWLAETQAVLTQRPDLDKTRAIHQGNPEITRSATTENDADRKSNPALSDRQYNLLQALYELEAFHADSKQTTLAIAYKAEGPNINPETFKEPIAELKRLGLADTKEGRKGGCWLTSKGKRLIKKVRKL